jgi:o-succinylbenzoate synthase
MNDANARDDTETPSLDAAGLFDLRVYRLPMRVRFRRLDVRTGMLLRGPAGWGEFSPFPEYGHAYASRWLAAALEAATEPFPDPMRSEVPVNTTIPAVDPGDAHRMAANSGCTTAKVKVAENGQTLAQDVERVAAVRDALGPEGHIRVDANGAWDVASAVLAIARLDRAAKGLEYVEQPCETLDELRDVRRRVEVAIAADESIRTAADPLRVATTDAADVLVLKVQPLGGVRRALEVADAAGLPVVVSSALETSVGLAAGVAFAAALPELPFACGLGTATLLAGDVTDNPLQPRDGALPVRRVAPDAASLDQVAAGPEETGWWLERLRACAEALASPEDGDPADAGH